MRLLGIDYGTKNIGLAVGEAKSIASPFGIIENKGKNQVLEKIKKFIEEEEAGMIILGLPQTKSGIPSKTTKEVLDFGEFLSQNLLLPVKYQNEQFTSKEVEKLFQNFKKEKKGLKKDAVEAMLILQSYIDKIKDKI